MSTFTSCSFTLSAPNADANLTFTYKRYHPVQRPSTHLKPLALVMTHCIGAHKETFEPTIEHIFRLQAKQKGVVIGEIWTVDAPNHGEGGVINEKELLQDDFEITYRLWGDAIKTLVNSDLLSGKNVVGIGHSGGASALVLSTTGCPIDKLPYTALIIMELGALTRENWWEAMNDPSRHALLAKVVETTEKRKDIWSSRDVARDWFRKRFPWNRWDPAVFGLFIEYALRNLPTLLYPDQRAGVTLTCTRKQEAAYWTFHEDAFDTLDRLSELCPKFPVHLVLGEYCDLVTEETHQGVMDATKGRKMTSISRIFQVRVTWWPDLVLARMQKNPATQNIAVLNQAAGGNRILADGLGPNALGRIDRDVLAQSGIKYAMIFEGVNDIGVADPTPEAQQVIGDQLIWAFKQIVERVHTFNIPIFAATITPFSGNATIQPYLNPVKATRQRINKFIRTSGIFDAVIDFEKVVADPNQPDQLDPKFDSGDFLHPNVAGYTAMANAFPLDVFNIQPHFGP